MYSRMAMAATEIDRNSDVAGMEFKSSLDVSMDGSQEDHSQALDSFADETPALTMETSTGTSSTADADICLDNTGGESDNDLEELEELVEIDENIIHEICPVDGPCVQCEIEQPCSFRFTDNGETLYVCNEPCINAYQAQYPEKYTVTRMKYLIEEITPSTLLCTECEERKTCYFYYNFHGEDTYYCSLSCLEVMMCDEKDKYAFKRVQVTIDQIRSKEEKCFICEKIKPCQFSLVRYGETRFLCKRICIKILSGRERGRYYIKKLRVTKPAVCNAIDKNLDEGYKIQEKTAARVQCEQSFHRRCSQCTQILMLDENVLAWEAMDFCDEKCLERFQTGIGSRCAKCNNLVQHTSLGKYCVRFGYDIRQFCNSRCLAEFKKGLKICLYCQIDISTSTQIYLAPVGAYVQLKAFCAQSCVEKINQMSKNPVPQPVWAKCAVCSLEKATTIEMEVTETASQRICSDPCFAAYKFANNILPDQCKWCKKYFERKLTKSFTIYNNPNPHFFCSQSCMMIHINHTKFIVSCQQCKSKKYNFDMIRRVDNGKAVMLCSLYCLSLNQESTNNLSLSRSVSRPTFAPPLPSIEQSKADETSLAVEQLTTLTKSRKRRKTPQSSKQNVQSNESANKFRFAVPDSPLSSSSPKKKARRPTVPHSLRFSSKKEARGQTLPHSLRSSPKKKARSPSVHGSRRRRLLEALHRPDDNSSSSEAQDTMAADPGHVKRCSGGVTDAGAQEYALFKPLTPSTVAVECSDSASGGVSVHDHDLNPSIAESMPKNSSAVAGVRPPTSGVTATPMTTNSLSKSLPLATELLVTGTRSSVANGSDFDSEFDDEFDERSGETTTVETGISRYIPDDEDLEDSVREVITGIEKAIDDEADRIVGPSSSFTWHKDFDTFRGIPEFFSGDTPGPIKDYDTPYDCFIEIWDRDMIERIAQETNRYAKQTIDSLKAKGELKPSSRLHDWTPTDADEMMVFFAVIMYMGIDSRTSLKEYWHSDDFLEMPNFKKIMTDSRYILLNKFLHFVDNNCIQNEEGLSPKVAKLGPVIGHLNNKFSTLYHLAREISIDESLTLFKGRLSWVQAIRTKAGRFGIKSFELCESSTGYMYKFEIFTGKNSASLTVAPSTDLSDKSTVVVLDLLKGLENLGHCVTMDNYYNCPSLARYLKSLGFDCLGTMRTNRRHVPSDIAEIPKNVAKGTIVARHCGDVSVVAWKDSKLVTIISTYHKDDTYVGSRAGKTLVKPVSVRDYNKTMGGVDLKDQKLSMYLLERKRSLKLYVKIFKRLLNVSIHNAYVMFVSSLKRQNKALMTHREFRYNLAKSLVVKHRACIPEVVQPVDELMRLRRDVLHVPKYDAGRSSRKRCAVCYRQDISKTVHTQCATCETFLCFEVCWTEWHSSVNLKGREKRRRQRRKRVENNRGATVGSYGNPYSAPS